MKPVTMPRNRWAEFVLQPVTKLAATPGFYRVSHTLTRSDHLLQRATGNRVSWVRLAGMTSLLLYVPGRKTGKVTEVNVLAITEPGETWLIGGSNFGRPTHPLWTLNLMSAERIDAVVQGEQMQLQVEHLTGAQRDAAFARMNRKWPNYALYEQRSGRTIRIFRLSRTA